MLITLETQYKIHQLMSKIFKFCMNPGTTCIIGMWLMVFLVYQGATLFEVCCSATALTLNIIIAMFVGNKLRSLDE